jgi:hypothetical protein
MVDGVIAVYFDIRIAHNEISVSHVRPQVNELFNYFRIGTIDGENHVTAAARDEGDNLVIVNEPDSVKYVHILNRKYMWVVVHVLSRIMLDTITVKS